MPGLDHGSPLERRPIGRMPAAAKVDADPDYRGINPGLAFGSSTVLRLGPCDRGNTRRRFGRRRTDPRSHGPPSRDTVDADRKRKDNRSALGLIRASGRDRVTSLPSEVVNCRSSLAMTAPGCCRNRHADQGWRRSLIRRHWAWPANPLWSRSPPCGLIPGSSLVPDRYCGPNGNPPERRA
jgi:hypothetical protein